LIDAKTIIPIIGLLKPDSECSLSCNMHRKVLEANPAQDVQYVLDTESIIGLLDEFGRSDVDIHGTLDNRKMIVRCDLSNILIFTYGVENCLSLLFDILPQTGRLPMDQCYNT
jgi:hypothetical protein